LKIDLGLVLEVMMIPSFPTRPDDMAFNSKRQEPQLILSVYFCTQTGRWLVCLTTVQQQKKNAIFQSTHNQTEPSLDGEAVIKAFKNFWQLL